MLININDSVKVKLTNKGKEILLKKHLELESNTKLRLDFQIKVDKDGYTEFQMHDLMYTFGEYMYVGNNEQPFESNIIIKEASNGK